MDAPHLLNTHVKLLAFDFLTLKPTPYDPTSFSRKGKRLSRAETLGIVVTRDFKPNKFVKFDVDDGTGCIPCILWLNQETSRHFSRRCPSDVRLISQMAADFASQVQLGVIARVRGRISSYRGNLQITVADVVIERDPNSQILDCLRRTSSSLNKEALHLSSSSESSELKLPDASLLLNSPTMPGHLGLNTDHSSRVAAAMAENATRKRDINVSASTYPRSKIPKGTLPHMKNVPETGGSLLLPPQLAGRSNIVTEDIGKLFRKKTSS